MVDKQSLRDQAAQEIDRLKRELQQVQNANLSAGPVPSVSHDRAILETKPDIVVLSARGIISICENNSARY